MLESDFVFYRGEAPFKIAIPSISSVTVDSSNLRIAWPGHEAAFELGAEAAEKWKSKLLNPKGILDKLGVKPGMKVAAFHIADEAFLAMLRDRLTLDQKGQDCDIVLLGVEAADGLKQIAGFARRIHPAGALWTVYPKGRKDLTQADVMNAVRDYGLVDVKVAAFSPTHTALKWMVPKQQRKA